MPRHYRETVALPDDLDLRTFEAVRLFVHRTIRSRGSTFRKPFKVVCEQVEVDTGDSVIKEGSLDRALAALEPGDDVETVEVAIFTGRGDGAVALVWHRVGSSHIDVAGAEQIWVLGLSRSLDLLVRRREFERPEPRRRQWSSRGMPKGVVVQALGTVVATGLIALIGALVAIVFR